MCEKAVEKNPLLLKHIPDLYKTKEMHNEEVQKIQCLLEYVPLSVQQPWDDWYIKKTGWEKNCFLATWHAQIKHVLIKEDVEIWSKSGYN